MPIAAFKDLCLDATDARALARFWADALDATVVRSHGGWRIDRGGVGPESIHVDPVPEPRTVRTRVHLDLRLAAPDPAPLVALGATVVREPDDEISWWELTDVEGNVFCAFPPRDGAGGPGVFELIVYAADPEAQARWWAGVCGGTVEVGSFGAGVTGAAGFPWDYWVFDPVPQPKTVKNRLHWDVDLTDPDPSALVAAGARILREPDSDISWWIMADPEGNEFCAFPG